jgi:hypothetical protein
MMAFQRRRPVEELVTSSDRSCRCGEVRWWRRNTRMRTEGHRLFAHRKGVDGDDATSAWWCSSDGGAVLVAQ